MSGWGGGGGGRRMREGGARAGGGGGRGADKYTNTDMKTGMINQGGCGGGGGGGVEHINTRTLT